MTDRRAMTLAQVRRYALSLPGSTEEPHFERTSFRVSKRIFLTARPGESHVHAFVPDQDRAPALALHGDFVSPLLWGKKVVGLRIDLPHADPAIVRALIEAAWRSKAPKASIASSSSSSSSSSSASKTPKASKAPKAPNALKAPEARRGDRSAPSR